MFCWTQSFVVFSFFSRCCHGFVSSLWIIHILSTLLTCNQQTWRLCTTGTEHFYVWLMWLTSNHIRSNWNCNYVTKKTVSSLFCTVLIYFEQVYFQVIVYFVLSEKDTKIVAHQPLTSYELSSRQQLWYVLIYGSVSVFVYTMTSCIKRKLQSMVTALEYL